MQSTVGRDASIRSGVRDDGRHSIVSELVSLIGHIQSGIQLLEAAIASEAAAGEQDLVADVVVLDDVTPGYVRAKAALNTCNAGLGMAVHSLLDSRTASHPAGEVVTGDRSRLHSIGRA
jgi:hypothetical protein